MKWVSVAVLGAMLVTVGTVAADELDDLRSAPMTPPSAPTNKSDDKKPIFNKPIYYPETKSYFELSFPGEKMEYANQPAFNWEDAKEYAESRMFHGVRGHLAVVKTKETNDFIIKSFHWTNGWPWIGLRLLCNGRELQWVTGEFWPLSGYANWGRIWNLFGTGVHGTKRIECININVGATLGKYYLPVHYWGQDGGYKWNANGPLKEMNHMLIEYNTGKP